MKNKSFDESSSNGKAKNDDNELFKERQAKQGIGNTRLSVFHEDYLYVVRETDSFLIVNVNDVKYIN